ncbi:subtilisin like protease [Chondromyces crocatus]|uniref:Subtilisin like protease n=2 Tax=Chondromyces crocatus TaxID=52 RepID=A0A0K1E5T7_CHOCO|nr:subtilisin like protease [Chondromyces crocatus]
MTRMARTLARLVGLVAPSLFSASTALVALAALAASTALAAPTAPVPPALPTAVAVSALPRVTSTVPTAPTAAASSAFLDGARLVAAERLGAPSVDAQGRRLTRVRLRYDASFAHADAFAHDAGVAPFASTGDLRAPRTVDALVDHTAIVQISPGAEAAVEAAGVRLVRPLMPALGLWLAESADADHDADGLALAVRLQAEVARGVEQAVPNLYLRVRPAAEPFTPNDPMLPDQWYLNKLRMPETWGLHRGDPDTRVVIVDTGCDLGHPDLVAKLDTSLDVVSPTGDGSYAASDSGAGHGTACAGIVAAATDNDEGIAGVCPDCRLSCVRLLADFELPVSAAVEAFDFALRTDAAVVSNSWGYDKGLPVPQVVADAVDKVFRDGRGGKGALVIFAAGNDSREIEPQEIQALPSVFAIGAVNHWGDKTTFTNFGAAVSLVAPAGTVTTDIRGGGGYSSGNYTDLFGGTSSACPVVAGVAALLASAAPELTAEHFYDLMIRTASPADLAVPDENGHDPVYGYGVINPLTALTTALAERPPPEPEPPSPPDDKPKADAADEGGCAFAPAPARSIGGLGFSVAALAVAAYAGRRRRR